MKIYRHERYHFVNFQSIGWKNIKSRLCDKNNQKLEPILQVHKMHKDSAIPGNLFDRHFLLQGKHFNIIPKDIKNNIGSDKINSIKSKF